jgi:ParB-like chromosome segregation protein Spo0J
MPEKFAVDRNAAPKSQSAPVERGGRFAVVAVEERRKAAFRLVALKGMTESAAARILKVSRRTVVRDLGNVRARLEVEPGKFNAAYEVALAARRYEALGFLALQQMSLVESPHSKVTLMSAALRAMEARVRLLQAAGLLPRLPRGSA